MGKKEARATGVAVWGDTGGRTAGGVRVWGEATTWMGTRMGAPSTSLRPCMYEPSSSARRTHSRTATKRCMSSARGADSSIDTSGERFLEPLEASSPLDAVPTDPERSRLPSLPPLPLPPFSFSSPDLDLGLPVIASVMARIHSARSFFDAAIHSRRG